MPTATFAAFRSGKWVEYIPRVEAASNPRLTERLFYLGASVYATAKQKGYDENTAHLVAEAIMFKRLYKDIEYDTDTEAQIKKLTC